MKRINSFCFHIYCYIYRKRIFLVRIKSDHPFIHAINKGEIAIALSFTDKGELGEG